MRFAVSGPSNWVAYCHCASCRGATGAPVAAYAGFPAAAVRFSGDQPAQFVSSPGVSRGFCGRCGSPVSFVGERWPGEIHLHLGCFDHPDLVPTAEAFALERLPWLHLTLT